MEGNYSINSIRGQNVSLRHIFGSAQCVTQSWIHVLTLVEKATKKARLRTNHCV